MDLDGGPPLRFARGAGLDRSHCVPVVETDLTGNSGGFEIAGSLKRCNKSAHP